MLDTGEADIKTKLVSQELTKKAHRHPQQSTESPGKAYDKSVKWK